MARNFGGEGVFEFVTGLSNSRKDGVPKVTAFSGQLPKYAPSVRNTAGVPHLRKMAFRFPAPEKT